MKSIPKGEGEVSEMNVTVLNVGTNQKGAPE